MEGIWACCAHRMFYVMVYSSKACKPVSCHATTSATCDALLVLHAIPAMQLKFVSCKLSGCSIVRDTQTIGAAFSHWASHSFASCLLIVVC